jgi:cyclophilin family peptidyl-prolyl cis-trans isomerase
MSGSQFYIVQGSEGAHHLDGQHTVFGKITEGIEFVDDIAEVATDANDRPLNPILIAKAYVVYE